MDLNTRKTTLRLFSNGVYIITSRDGDKVGAATVTWISQASFKPPLIMAAIRPESNVFKCLSHSGVAAIHIVDHGQEIVAQRFFTRTFVASGTINGEPYQDGSTSAPILKNFGAHIECRVRRIVDGIGDHALILMEVHDAECRGAVNPLTIRESPWQYGG